MPLPRAIAAPGKHGSHDTAPAGHGASLSIGLSAVIVAASVQESRVLTIRLPSRGEGDGSVEALPSGPLEAEHRTLEIGLRTWVERQTSQTLGYVEQLYTFGDRDRVMGEDSPGLPALVVAYLALVREARPAGSADAMWQGCYRYFPWEDWREGKPESLARIEDRLSGWAQDAASEPERRLRQERLGLAFGDRKSTRLNSSHRTISYAVFCLKKKKILWRYLLRPNHYSCEAVRRRC